MIVYDIGTLADWLTAVGTISAVVVALYLSRKDDKPRARVKASVSHLMTVDEGVSPYPVSISLGIVNTGKIPIHLAECTVQANRFNKQRLTFLDGRHKVERMLHPGEFYEHSLEYEPIFIYLRNKKIKNLKTYMYFRDSLDNVYKAKVTLRS